jgi:hypothetical protein
MMQNSETRSQMMTEFIVKISSNKRVMKMMQDDLKMMNMMMQGNNMQMMDSNIMTDKNSMKVMMQNSMKDVRMMNQMMEMMHIEGFMSDYCMRKE